MASTATTTASPTCPTDNSEWPLVKVYGMDFRTELNTMAQTVEKYGLWSWFRTESPPEGTGYMFWGHENVSLINNNLPNNEHSGATFGFALRVMQAIAKKGFENWKQGIIATTQVPE